MKLINLKNGNHINVIQWKLNNLRSIKKFVPSGVSDYMLSVMVYPKSNLHYEINKNHSLKISLVVHINDNVFRKHTVTIPAHDYLMCDLLSSTMAKVLVPVAKSTIDNNYGRPHITKCHYISHKSGVHYTCYQYDGTWASIPGFLSDDIKNNGTYNIDTQHTFHIHYSNQKPIIVKPKDWLLIPVSDNDAGLVSPNEPKVVTSHELKVGFYHSQPVKLPKYVFTVTKSINELSDSDAQVVGTSSTYTGAKKIIRKAEKMYSIISARNGDDSGLSGCPNFSIIGNKTRDFTEHDLTEGY